MPQPVGEFSLTERAVPDLPLVGNAGWETALDSSGRQREDSVLSAGAGWRYDPFML